MKVIAKYWGHIDDDPREALLTGWWIEYQGENPWYHIAQDGLSSDDYLFEEVET